MTRIHTKLPVGTAVYHAGQIWARALVGGTAVITAVADRPCRDGSWEYTVLACRRFAWRPAADNPMDREALWNSLNVRRALIAEDLEKL